MIDVPLSELRFRFVRSRGPGGQHVNTSSTQVELLFDVANSPSLSEAQKARLLAKLASYIDKEGILHLSSQSTRSQHQNRQDIIVRFQRLVHSALRVPKKRRPTRPTAASRERRLEAKHQRGQIKRMRRQTGDG
ncbi:MAG: aminoacyl-tRNA hydrolase [Thermoflexales bacterium]|nr:aminoacyl-tRNA hydrolase [Thermoflexales bacterium]